MADANNPPDRGERATGMIGALVQRPPRLLPLAALAAGAWRLYRGHLRLFAGTAAMVTILQTLELFYIPTVAVPLLFLGFWPVIVGVMSQAIGDAGAGRPAASVQSVYDTLGKLGFLRLVIANVGIALLVLIGLCLVIAPGVYLWIRFQFVPQVLVRERCGLREAFRRSSALVHGRWWSVFGKVLATYTAATVLNLLAIVIIALLSTTAHWPDTVTGAAAVVSITALWALMDPLFFGVLLLLYADLRRVQGSAPTATST